MKNNRLGQQIQHSLNAELSGLNTTSRQRNQYYENATGGIKVKRKLTYGLVLAIIMLLIAATAGELRRIFPRMSWLLLSGSAIRTALTSTRTTSS